MKSYQKTVQVTSEDLDDLNHVNNIRYIEWIQDISKEHWQAAVPINQRNGVIWVVVSHHIQYRGEARLGDVVEVNTYIAETRGPLSIRAVEMYLAGTDVLLVESRTEWCLLNANTLKPMRISKELRSFFE